MIISRTASVGRTRNGGTENRNDARSEYLHRLHTMYVGFGIKEHATVIQMR